ncbi:hypothetical protein PRK78_007519 [Emydomyces testavorans]|uniref:Mediator of RNA polymerase II transcription subunit 4 n=1 Tax=Emydomyces testavorans TaxID=2070801 RepID=A0AAF0DNC6_9EURO|nr:hypothetical protein PRK78_007519 [Emydomyces testavorans]
MDSALYTPLSTIEQRLNALVTSITSSPTAANAPAAALALLEADDSLTSALETLRTHQANYAKILHLRAEAKSLEERIRNIVQEIGNMGGDISSLVDNDDDHDDDDDDENDSSSSSSSSSTEIKQPHDQDVQMDGTIPPQPPRRRRRKHEIDYHLLLDFARRISKYNTHAASAATSGTIPTKPRPSAQDEPRSPDHAQSQLHDPHKETPEHPQHHDTGVAAITKQSTSQLDASAHSIRQAWLLPYPNENKIRMGVMGKLQAAVAASGARCEERDIEREVERIMRAVEEMGSGKEGLGVPDKGEMHGDSEQATVRVDGKTGAGGVTGAVSGGGGVARPVAAAKGRLDLDLYDPDEDDIFAFYIVQLCNLHIPPMHLSGTRFTRTIFQTTRHTRQMAFAVIENYSVDTEILPRSAYNSVSTKFPMHWQSSAMPSFMERNKWPAAQSWHAWSLHGRR